MSKTEKLRSANYVLYDKENRLLLQHRSDGIKILPDYWAFFGGKIDKEETPKEAAIRESQEELDYKLKNPEFVFEQDFKLEDISGHMWVYIDEFKGDKETLKLREGKGFGWYAKEETENLKMIDHDRCVIEVIEKYLKTKHESSRS